MHEEEEKNITKIKIYNDEIRKALSLEIGFLNAISCEIY